MDTVTIKGLSKSYGSIRALRDLSVTIPAGAVGLLGPNGAGKSTLLKVLLGLLPLDDGAAWVLDRDVVLEPAEVRRAVGYMPEVDAYLPGLTGAQAVVYCGILCGLPRREAQRRAHEILYYVGLGEARYRRTEQYSTGMRQRLRLAQALVHDPALIFLDEPTNGLDPAGRDEVLELINDLATTHGKSVVLCSHLLHDVEAVCEYVVVLREGEVALAGSVDEVRKLETGTWRVRVAGDDSRFGEQLAELGMELARSIDDAIEIRVPQTHGAREIFRAARAAGCVIRGLSTVEQSLTGVFLKAVEEDY